MPKIFVLCFSLVLAVGSAAAWAGGPGCGCDDGCGCNDGCDSCDRGCPACGYCYPEVKVGKEKKHCWECEVKQICIPAVQFPWQKCCEPPRCGYTRTVRTIVKKECEVEKCEYKWHIENPCPACGHSCDEPCGSEAAPPAPTAREPYFDSPAPSARIPDPPVAIGGSSAPRGGLRFSQRADQVR